MAILKKKCREKNVEIYDSVINYIAENIKTNVRDLEGSLTTLIAYSTLIKQKITLETAQEQLKNIISASQRAGHFHQHDRKGSRILLQH